MNLSADALLFLAAKGMSVEDIAEFVRLTEKRKDPTAADRMARYRERQKKGGRVTRNVTANPPIEDHTPSSVISSDDEKQNTPRKQRGSVGVRPDDIPEPLWEDWVKHRGKHRSDIGPTTIAAYRREAADVGWTLEQAMTEQISRGWRGFKAKWVKDDDRPAPRPNPADTFRSVRGSRPNPALDMVLQAERELQAEAFRQNPGPDWEAWPALPSGQPS